jgi:hypothetical protein
MIDQISSQRRQTYSVVGMSIKRGAGQSGLARFNHAQAIAAKR